MQLAVGFHHRETTSEHNHCEHRGLPRMCAETAPLHPPELQLHTDAKLQPLRHFCR